VFSSAFAPSRLRCYDRRPIFDCVFDFVPGRAIRVAPINSLRSATPSKLSFYDIIPVFSRSIVPGGSREFGSIGNGFFSMIGECCGPLENDRGLTTDVIFDRSHEQYDASSMTRHKLISPFCYLNVHSGEYRWNFPM